MLALAYIYCKRSESADFAVAIASWTTIEDDGERGSVFALSHVFHRPQVLAGDYTESVINRPVPVLGGHQLQYVEARFEVLVAIAECIEGGTVGERQIALQVRFANHMRQRFEHLPEPLLAALRT